MMQLHPVAEAVITCVLDTKRYSPVVRSAKHVLFCELYGSVCMSLSTSVN